LVESSPTGDLGYGINDKAAAGEVETRVVEVGLGSEVVDLQNV